MTDRQHTMTFSTLLEACQQVVVPQIQRDYAQGRHSAQEVRDSFLTVLHEALTLPPEHERLPLNLDFIYGSIEDSGGRAFLPLDGQQRLTTLFLLHWYLAWRDGMFSQFRSLVWGGRHSRFSYQVRPSGTQFFDGLVTKFEPAPSPDTVPSVRALIENRPWFFLAWRLDPTIQSALTMLEGIHERFRGTSGLYARLVDREQPAITFQMLSLEHFGLTDDLYIKMNARGKPLTVFETFKARFEEQLKDLYPTDQRRIEGRDVGVAKFFAMRMDTRWTDFFWSHRDAATDTFDDAAMNLLWAMARISLDPALPTFGAETGLLRSRHLGMTFTTFHECGWLTRTFVDWLIALLEAWSAGGGGLTWQLPDTRYFDELAFFQKAVRNPYGLEYAELVQFAALVSYLHRNEGAVDAAELQAWMRVIFNLSVNSGIEHSEDYGRALSAVRALLPHSRQILQHLATVPTEPPGFAAQQMREEVLKAKLILADPSWGMRIDAAETHGYFRGQIEFLLDFSGVVGKAKDVPVTQWAADEHADLQSRFDDYSAKAQPMFRTSGLNAADLPGKPFLWQRGLLVCGDYLSSKGSNHSFLTDAVGSWSSWKRYLRGETSGGSPRRRYLKALWDRLDATAPIGPQLDQIINSRPALEAWREAVVKHGGAISYCEEREIRRIGSEDRVYLLRRHQMNGAHVELFSYALYLELNNASRMGGLFPLKLQPYVPVAGSEYEPHFVLLCERPGDGIEFYVLSQGGSSLSA
jgi:hypothetical protein